MILTFAVSSGMVKSSAVHAAVALAPKDFQTGRGLTLESCAGGDIFSFFAGASDAPLSCYDSTPSDICGRRAQVSSNLCKLTIFRTSSKIEEIMSQSS